MASTHLAFVNEELALPRKQVLMLVDEYDKCVGYASRTSATPAMGSCIEQLRSYYATKTKNFYFKNASRCYGTISGIFQVLHIHSIIRTTTSHTRMLREDV